jgi:hypothetical protein
MKRLIVMAASVLLALSLAMPAAFGQVGTGATASRANQKLVTAWSQWSLANHIADNPLFGGDPDYSAKQCDGTPLNNTADDQWFLAGTLDGSTVVRTCTMPSDKDLFFPAFETAIIATVDTDTEASMLTQAHDFMTAVQDSRGFNMVVKVDGKVVPNQKIVRAEAPLFSGQSLLFVDLGPPFSYSYQAVADGRWVKVPALPDGKHTIHWEVSAPNADTDPTTPGAEGFSQNNTYRLTVR